MDFLVSSGSTPPPSHHRRPHTLLSLFLFQTWLAAAVRRTCPSLAVPIEIDKIARHQRRGRTSHRRCRVLLLAIGHGFSKVSCLDLISYMRKCTAVIAAGVCTFQNGLVALQGCDGLVLIESMVNSTAEKVVIPNNPSLQAPALRSHRAEGSH